MPTTLPVTKSLFLNAQVCPTLAWYQAHEKDGADEISVADQFRMREGMEVGEQARKLFPAGVLVRARRMEEAVKETQTLLADAKVTVIFEAAFSVGGVVARADVLIRDRAGWRLLEVKSSLNDSEELVADLAYTTMVLFRAGLKIVRASLLLLSRDYRVGMPVANLFGEVDHTGDVMPQVPSIGKAADARSRLLNAPTRPAPKLIKACRDCSFFEGPCLGKGVEHHILTLPRLSEKRFAELSSMGITTIASIPASAELTESQSVVRKAVINGKPVWDKAALKALLLKVKWPAGYLDFETFKTAIPLYPGIGPHEQVVTQYSLHVCDGPETDPSHSEYLAETTVDCRRQLAETLLRHLAPMKSIIVYSGFEKRVLSELQKLFPDLRGDRQGCIDRIFDLEAAVKPGVFYHPGFGGRSSIKATFPVLVPNMSYADLSIQDGDMAIAKFAMMVRGEISGAEAKVTRQQLLAYCERDTLAMVKLHQALCSLVK